MRTDRMAASALALATMAAGTGSAAAEDVSRVEILSATVRDQKINAATVILQKNGEQSVTTATGVQGDARLPTAAATDPSALLIVRHAGYSDLVAKCPCAGMTYALSPIMQKLDGMRIVLNWGAHPSDLDGHLAFRGNHVYFRDQQGTDANLDVDHINGFGPETITISRKHAGERYVYAVQDFTNKADPDAAELSDSQAKVFVYVGQTLVKSYYVPAHRRGNLWTVFAVSAEGEIQDIDTLSSISVNDEKQLTVQTLFGASASDASAPQPGNSAGAPGPADGRTALSGAELIPTGARALNLQGETAYRGHDIATAIRSFQAAIEQYSGYGQAYSNLGLAYQKSGRVAEALWANRKAIALAAGAHGAQTRASTHFNNGRIYEEARQWDDALREYRAAQAERASDVYTLAIQRMTVNGAQ